MKNDKYFEPEIETMPRKDIEALQVKLLKGSIERAKKSPFYAKKFAEYNVTADMINSVEDVRKLPFTTKQDMRDNYPFGFVACDMKNLIRLHSSSGTTGNPTVICHTKTDIELWANRMARCLYMAGLRDTDVIQNSSGYGMFTGGLGIHYGIEKLGALSVPAGAGNTLRQIKFIRDFGTTAIHIIPSYALRLADVFDEMGINARTDTKLTTLIIGAEPHTEATRRVIEERLGVKAYNCFGMTEMCGPGVAFECPEQNGMHLWEDSFLAEIVDPETLEPKPIGEVGELILTPLNREGMPLIRYRTRDLTRILPGECPCGRTHIRLDRFKGRSDDMFIVKGVNIFPMQIEKILMQFSELGTNYLITVQSEGSNDVITVEVELGNLFTDDFATLQNLTKEITRRLKDEILVTPKVKLVGRNTLPQSEGKAVRVKDLRPKA